MIDTLFPTGWAHYLAGGLLIGTGVSLLYLALGAIGGMSTVFSSTWSWLLRGPWWQQARFVESRQWRLWLAWGPSAGLHTQVPVWRLGLGGLLVGFGARLSNGCTSGHGICGLASLQAPALAAVLTFMATGILTAHLVARLAGGLA